MDTGFAQITEAEASARTREVERAGRLLEKEIDGFAPWQLVRFETAIALQGLALGRKAISRGRLLSSLPKALGQWAHLPKRVRYLCKSFDSSHRLDSPAGYRDVYFDDLLDGVSGGLKISSCDVGGFEHALDRAAIPPRFDDTSIIAASALMARLKPRYSGHPVFEDIAEAFAGRQGFAVTAGRLASVYNAFWWRERLYRQLLKRLRPSAVVCADGGQFALMMACRNLSIPYIELQHGIATSAHPNLLPADLTAAERAHVLVPDLSAVYGTQSMEALRDTLLHLEGRIRPVGAGHIEHARRFRKDWPADSVRTTLTLTTQGIATEELIDFVRRFLSPLESDVLLNVKLHPAYNLDAERYRQVFGNDGRVVIHDGSANTSTQQLIAESHMHVSISSTCHYDALGCGTPTGIIALNSYESIAELAALQGAMLLRAPEDLAHVVEGRNFPAVPDTVRERFFSAGFLSNMEGLLPAG